MSYYSSLQRTVTVDQTAGPIAWPADLELVLSLAPGEVFGASDAGEPGVVVNHEAEVSVDPITGKMLIRSKQGLSSANIIGTFPSGTLSVTGSTATVKLPVSDERHLNAVVDWVVVGFSHFLSIQLGVFAEVKSVLGTLGGRKLSAMYPDGTYSALLTFLTDQERDLLIGAALETIQQDNPSYPRLVVSSFYFHHALRFLSPHEVRYVPYCAHAEVMLNLTKCLEILLGASRREDLRRIGRDFGYSASEIESQIIPIFLMRNEIDVAHAVGSRIDMKELILFRKYIDRSVLNVGAILRQAIEHIRERRLVLKPFNAEGCAERSKFNTKIRTYLEGSALATNKRTTIIGSG
jgi:hypothetical protein